jgi:hypothetical protein
MHVITGDQIDAFRLKAISCALKLESKGLKGRVKASVIARDILNKNGIKAEKNLVKLCEQFKQFILEKEAT